jgi:hypothetical protein
MLKYDVKLDENKNNIILKICLFKKRWHCHGALYIKNETAFHLFKTTECV